MPRANDAPIGRFADADDWEAWLAEHHGEARELLVRIAKRGSGETTVTYDEALDVALCYGWIDGQRKAYDERSFVQRFTPRRARSLWSARNVAKAAALIDAGRMRPAGLAEIEAARADGRWAAAYPSGRDMVVPDDLARALAANERARAFFDALGKAERYPILLGLHGIKRPETRARRLAALLDLWSQDGTSPA